MGIDLGSKTIGIACCDENWTVASPITTIKRTKFKEDAQKIVEIINERKIVGIVIGWPINMDGSEGTRCQATRAFQREFEKIIKLPCLFWDERLSTVAAEKAMIESDMSRKKRKEKIDAVAATLILQSLIDRLTNK